MLNCFHKHFPFTAAELYYLFTCPVTWNAVLPSFEASVTYEKPSASSPPKNENLILAFVYIYIYICIVSSHIFYI